jgi:single-strand DNA-binding protein
MNKENDMGSVNRVYLLGNLGADPVVRTTAKGTKVANISLATSRRWKDADSDKVNEVTDWHRVVLWGKRAELAEDHLKKGSPLHVEGELRNRSWTDKDGSKRYTTEVIAQRIQLLGKPERPAGDPPTLEEPPADQEPDVPEDDIPF